MYSPVCHVCGINTFMQMHPYNAIDISLHHPVLPITVSSFPSHHVIMAGCSSPRVFLLPPIWSVKKNSSCVLVKCTYPVGLPAVQVPGSVGTTWYGPGTLMNNVACTASHSPGVKLKWKDLCGHLMPTEYADYVTFVFELILHHNNTCKH